MPWLVPPVFSRLVKPAVLVLGVCGVGAVAAAAARDRAAAVGATLTELRHYPAHAALAREPIERAEHALRRARDARAAGDHEHAVLLEQVAEEWATTGRDLVRSAQVENDVAALQKRNAELETKVLRARALLEETLARRGRAQASLDQLETDAGAPSGADADAPSAGDAGAPPAADAAKPSTPRGATR